MKIKPQKTILVLFTITIVILRLACFYYLDFRHALNTGCNAIYAKKSAIYTNKSFLSEKTKKLNQHIMHCIKQYPLDEDYRYRTTRHDLKTTIALEDYLQFKGKAIGVMGSHSTRRGSKEYQDAAFIGKKLAEDKYIVVTGGTTGIMEATHLGVWFAGRTDKALMDALRILSQAPDVEAPGYFEKAMEVKRKYPRVMKTFDIAVPTYVFGVKYVNIFANTYVIYFNNALREETLLILSKNGVIFFPGGHGTTLELYLAKEYSSYGLKTNKQRPIILFGSKHWGNTLSPKSLDEYYLTDSIHDVFKHLGNTPK